MTNESKWLEISKAGNKDPVVCKYCKKPQHIWEKCWKLHDKTTNFQHAQTNSINQAVKNGPTMGQGQSRVTTMQPRRKTNSFKDQVEFNIEEIEKLKKILGTLEKSTGSSTCSLAFSSNISQSLTLSVLDLPTTRSWVVDSGTTYHMTKSSNDFVTYNPCPSNKKISTEYVFFFNFFYQ